MVGDAETKYHIALADNHPRMRREIRKLIAACRELEVVGEFQNGQEFLDFLEEKVPNLAILDVSMPGMVGLEATKKALARHPQIKILILITERNREYLVAALSVGAAGCLLKEHMDCEFLAAIAAIRQGDTYICRLFGNN